MSRHRDFANAVRGGDYDDDYDDDLSSSYGSVSNSFNSPTSSSYLFNRGNGEMRRRAPMGPDRPRAGAVEGAPFFCLC